jgi:multimeric flavodoxin WrbA
MKMLARLAEGWTEAGGGSVEILHLARRADLERAVAAYAEADVLMLGMPLYTDAMPAIVKDWIERLEPRVGMAGNPRMAFLVQSGFMESLHSRPLERYLAKLASRLGGGYAGTIVRGEGEALQSMPDEASEKMWERLRALGAQLARTGQFDPETLEKVSLIERMSPTVAALASLAVKLPIVQSYWNGPLKKNGVWDRRFAAPYAPAAR